ncbi:hypothetical protein ASE08_01780 [Rhizobacter sp. Root16D2]|nr:hypothetical protein ASE08_01780 [Rhizobacter sp. Root16D2]
MSKNDCCPPDAKPYGAMRRPLISTSVACAPRPRSETPPAPGVKLATAFELKLPALLAGRRFSSSVTDCAPERSIYSRVITCTGDAVSASMRLMREPVTSTRCSVFCAVLGVSGTGVSVV